MFALFIFGVCFVEYACGVLHDTNEDFDDYYTDAVEDTLAAMPCKVNCSNISYTFAAGHAVGSVCQLHKLVPVIDMFQEVDKYNGNHTAEVELAKALVSDPDVIESTEKLRKCLMHLVDKLLHMRDPSADVAKDIETYLTGNEEVLTGFVENEIASQLLSTPFTGQSSNASYNLREVHGLVYALMKSWQFKSDILKLAENDLVMKELESLEAVSRDVIVQRAADVRRSEELGCNAKYAEGIADALFQSFDSPVRFSFARPAYEFQEHVDGNRPNQWADCRKFLEIGKGAIPQQLTCSSELTPPLSPREKLHNGCDANGSAVLKWKYTGKNIYKLPEDTKITIKSGEVANGFHEWTTGANFPIVAGSSGTTANTLMLCKLLGFAPNDLVKMRKTMLATLVAQEDHSAIEVYLGADNFMPDDQRLQSIDKYNIAALFG